MKLRNKKTGSIFKIEDLDLGNDKDGIWIGMTQYKSLAELNEEWEDYEEPKERYYIDSQNDCVSEMFMPDRPTWDFNKSIGNYFETEEEAEKAVEKLKAFKRLKDKGFRFTLTPGVGSIDVTPGKFQIEISAEMPEKWFCCDAVQEDLDDCFGGEEGN